MALDADLHSGRQNWGVKMTKKSVKKFNDLTKDLPNRNDSKQYKNGDVVTFPVLIEIGKKLKEIRPDDGDDRPSLRECLEGTTLIFPRPEKIGKSAELEQRLERLRHEQENKEYRSMTGNVAAEPYGPSFIAEIVADIKSVKQQLTYLINMMVTVVGVFVFFYCVSGALTDRVQIRVLWGTVTATVVILVEIYFLVKWWL